MRPLHLLGLLATAGCQLPTADCTGVPAIVGAWQYAGVETTPARATVTGTLSITAASCDGIVGSMDVVRIDGAGVSRRLAGPISGQAVDDGSVQFDAFLEEAPRRHLATVAGDSLTGNWVSTIGAQSVSGSFGGRRQ